ncbi:MULTISPECIES: dienelactone hydrolase family protein [Thermomonosporaceae]|uniref:dienelactone hydrolase family protein n=1 Tax=Thermomonosporaceae TaxID=2012 RepID=UPI00255B2D21|nr:MULTISPECIES: hydrolase [Thermomonosporaceae]MDL4774754.1 hydrolase [Actinomadura xylanilytica]
MTGVLVPAGGVRLEGELTVPDGARGVVVFAHGSGSGRHSPRNREVAAALVPHGLGSLLFDLLTPAEDEIDRHTARLRFDVALLARRLGDAVRWTRSEAGVSAAADRPVGLFGASTGAAAALTTAAERPDDVGAVVSRGGRPDLTAPAALGRVRAPTLLIVGGRDLEVLSLNEHALDRMDAARGHGLKVVPCAGHLFEEPGALTEVSRLAAKWFTANLCD